MTANLFPDGKPKRKRKADAEQKAKLEALFTALVEACGADHALMTPSEERWYWMKASELLRKRVPAMPDDVHIVAKGILAKWTDKCVTPGSIANHFSEFVSGTATDRRLKREREDRAAQRLKWQKCLKRVSELDEATFTGLRGRLYRAWHTAPRTNPTLCEEICNLLDAESER